MGKGTFISNLAMQNKDILYIGIEVCKPVLALAVKKLARFEEENKIFKAVYHAIQETLLKAELISAPEKEVEDSKEAVEEVKQSHSFSNLLRL